MPKPPWFSAGLRFQCQLCSSCCRGEPGYVWVTPNEITRMAHHLGLTAAEFTQPYVRRVGTRLSLRELPGGDCVLWGGPERRCLAYPVRPLQCRTFPFWRQNLTSPAAWRTLARRCPGADKGPIHPLPEILKLLDHNP